MLNSWSIVSLVPSSVSQLTDLLDRHHYLHGVQAVKTEIVGEVRAGIELIGVQVRFVKRASSDRIMYLRGVVDLKSIISLFHALESRLRLPCQSS